MRRLQRNDHRAGVQTEHPGSRALATRQSARAGRLLLQIEQQRRARSTSIPATSPWASPAVRLTTSALATASNVPAKRPRACCTSKYAVATWSKASFRAACRSACAGSQFLAGGQRTEDGVGHGKVERRPASRRHAVLVVLDDRAVGRLVQSVMTVVVDPNVEIRQPEDVSILQQRSRLFHTRLGEGDHQRPGVRQA